MPATEKNTPFRLACFTIYDMQFDFTTLEEDLQYYAYGSEVCPTTDRPHYQAFGYSKRAQRMSWWIKLLKPHHVEKCIGSLDENDAYCKKEGSYSEWGVKPMANGKKRSLQELCDAVVSSVETGGMLCDVVTEPEHMATFVQYNNGITRLHQHCVTAKLRKIDKNIAPEVIYISGPPGCGKSRYVYDKEPDVFKIPASDKYKWKDGYSGQDAVLYDNMAKDNINPFELLQELDRYYMQVPVKGGFIGWRPRRIYITAVDSAAAVAAAGGFTDPQEFLRRITQEITPDPPGGSI